MCSYNCWRNWLFFISRISYPLSLILIAISLIFCWIGFSVPDWLQYTAINTFQTKLGLWSVCVNANTFFSQFVCSQWGSSSPDFLRTTQPMITLGCIFVTFAAAFGFLYLFFNLGIFKYLPVFAGVSSFIAFLFLIVGVSVFGGDYELFIANVAGSAYSRRWGYWLFVPTIMFLFLASILFPFKFLYKKYFANRLYNFVTHKHHIITPPIGVGFQSNSLSPAHFGGVLPTIESGEAVDEPNIFEYIPGASQNVHSRVSSGIFMPSIQTGQTNNENRSGRGQLILKPHDLNAETGFREVIEHINDDDLGSRNVEFNGFSLREANYLNSGLAQSFSTLDHSVNTNRTLPVIQKSQDKNRFWNRIKNFL